jgi:DUF1680 family protein
MKQPLYIILCLLIINTTGVFATDEISFVDRPSVQTANSYYVGNRSPLLPSHFIKLPVGSVKPKAWLNRYLELQRDGLTGHLGEISAWLDKNENAWLNSGSNAGWEEVPYWLKGYGNIAYILQDKKMLDETKTWIEAVLKSQQPDGYFGPINERDGKRELWANMIMLWCLQSYYEYSGDKRVIDLMTNYFKWQMTVPDEKFLEDYWENSRGGDNIYSVYWLYNLTGDSFLLDLAHKIHRNTADWMMESSLPNWHNVNIAQGFREPATYYMLSKDSAHLQASYNVHHLVRRTFGQVSGGMFGADENARMGYIDPRQGTETCGFVEQMASDEMMLRYTGDPFWAEHCEDVAFNSYPAAVMPDFKSLRYITSPNHVISDSKDHSPGIDNGGPFLAMNPFSSRCCQHNHAQGWPYYIENLLLATADNGVAACIYGACEATAKVGDGTEITIHEKTRYPFEETIHFVVKTPKKVKFPFYLRIPSWTEGAALYINEKKISINLSAGKYACINREWKDDDVISVHFPMQLAMQQWAVNKNSVSINYGPLTLSLNIEEEYKKVDSKASATGDSKWQENADSEKWPTWEIYPKSAWNYALVLNEKELLNTMTVEHREWPDDNFPFTQAASPVIVKAKGRQIPSWQIDRYGLCAVLPDENAQKSTQLDDITLTPMGAARLRITSFPLSSENIFTAKGGNPLIKHTPTADPTTLVSDGILYLYTSHDISGDNNWQRNPQEWLVFSSSDMQTWTEYPVPLKKSDFKWAPTDNQAWASHVVERNGKFYMYVTIGNFYTRNILIGVAVADDPFGPFVDAKGSPLITNAMRNTPMMNVDPMVFIDEDNQAYIFWGGSACCYAKLKDNMIELDGEIKPIDLPNFAVSPWLHKYNGWYYLSYAEGSPNKVGYAMSKSINGPWKYKGQLSEAMKDTRESQHAIVEFDGKWYFVYHDGYFGNKLLRSVNIDRLYYNEDGTIQKVQMTPNESGTNSIANALIGNRDGIIVEQIRNK